MDKKIYNRRYGMYLGRLRGYTLLRTRLITRSILQALNPQKEEVILEIGCNTGHLLSVLIRFCRLCVGIDINQDIINTLGNHRILSMSAGALAFKEGAFDKVCSAHTLEHIRGIKSVFREVHRVLKPGGIFVFSFPLELFRGQSAIKDSFVMYGHPFYAGKIHVHRLTPGKIRRVVVKRHFEVLNVFGNLTPFPECLMVLKKIGPVDTA